MKTNLKKRLLSLFKIKNWSQWTDVGLYDDEGRYYLIQMRYDLKTNRKKFRKAKMGFINDFGQKHDIFRTVMSHNAPKAPDHVGNVPSSEDLKKEWDRQQGKRPHRVVIKDIKKEILGEK